MIPSQTREAAPSGAGIAVGATSQGRRRHLPVVTCLGLLAASGACEDLASLRAWPEGFTLERSELRLGERPVVLLEAPYRRTADPVVPGAYVTHYLVVEYSGYNQHYRGAEHVLQPGERQVELEAPTRPGRFYVSLGERCCQTWDLWRHLEELRVESADTSDLEVGFLLSASRLTTGEPLMVSFDRPLSPRMGEYYEVELAPADEPETVCFGGRIVYTGAVGVALDTREHQGLYEVRLKGRHEQGCGRLVSRRPVELLPLPAEAPPSVSAGPFSPVFTLGESPLEEGGRLRLVFDPPFFPPEPFASYGAVVVPGSAPVSGTHQVEAVVQVGQRFLDLDTSRLPSGDYEVRILRYVSPENRVLARAFVTLLPRAAGEAASTAGQPRP